MRVFKKFKKLEIVVYLIVLLSAIAMLVANTIPSYRFYIMYRVNEPGQMLLFSFSLAAPVLALSSYALSWLCNPPIVTMRQIITPPVRVRANGLIPRLAFILFWSAVLSLLSLKILLLPNASTNLA